MRPLRMRFVFELILGAVLIASLLAIFRQARRIADLRHRQDADAQSLRLLRQALGKKCPEMAPPEVMEQTPAGDDHAAIARREAVIARLDRELAESRATITDLQTQLSTWKLRLEIGDGGAASPARRWPGDDRFRAWPWRWPSPASVLHLGGSHFSGYSPGPGGRRRDCASASWACRRRNWRRLAENRQQEAMSTAPKISSKTNRIRKGRVDPR